MSTNLKTALVHDFLCEYGGGERVLEALHQIFPEAPVYVAFYDQKALGKHWQRFKSWDLRQTWFSKIPGHKKFFSPLRFLAPKAFSDLDLSEYDLVISSSNAFMAKGVRARPGSHWCYCHTPPRSLYGYSTMSDWKKSKLVEFFGNLINHYMRVVDFKAAQKVDFFLANSKETQKRIKKFYRRESQVVYPPVQVEAAAKYCQPQDERKFFLYVNRLGLQKHPELAVQACTQLKLPLKVVGTGPLLPQLKEMAGSTVEFLGAVKDEQLWRLYGAARALIYPVEDEDFGMVPVEAMAGGTPVIAHHSGGPKETIISGKTGWFVFDFKLESWVKTLNQVASQSDWLKFDSTQISQSARQYSQQKFTAQIKELMLEPSQ
ncbi:MAG: glycosyltransferase [Candidatus Pacebacteria bacterium]|nr:glycosyltransferase [Candidatus Paceibacterota bacterium]